MKRPKKKRMYPFQLINKFTLLASTSNIPYLKPMSWKEAES